MTAVAAVAAVLLFYTFFYSRVVKTWAPAAQALVARLRLDADHPVREIAAVGKLAAAAVAQVLFAAVLWLLTGLDGGSVIGVRLDLVALGIVLGVGELAFAGSLSAATVQLASLVSPGGDRRPEGWLARARGGWMGYFIATATIAPVWLSATSIAVYVAVEELVFRAMLITTLASHGAVIAIGVSMALFVFVQAFGLPGVRAALFPIVGAAVIGATHGVIFWHVREIVPLVAAHLAFFSGALLLAAPADRPAASAVAR